MDIQVSISERACRVLFEGGPYDGQFRLVDHPNIGSFQFWDIAGEYLKRPGCQYIYEWQDPAHSEQKK